MNNYDALIVGSGPTGLIATRQLCSLGLKVALIEKASYSNLEARFNLDEIVNKYEAGGQLIVYSSSPLPLGVPAASGGGFSINAGFFQITEEKIYNEWPISKEPHFSYQQIRQNFESLSNELQPALINNDTLFVERMTIAAKNLGLSKNLVPRITVASRQRYFRETIDLVHKSGGDFFSDMSLFRLKKENKLWSARSKNRTLQAKFVFLAAGVINSPLLLSKSRIIPEKTFPLMYHPNIKMVVEFDFETTGQKPDVYPIQVRSQSDQITYGSSVSSKQHVLAELSRSGHKELSIIKNINKMTVMYASFASCDKTYMRCFHYLKKPIIYTPKTELRKVFELGVVELSRLAFGMGAKRIFIGGRTFTEPLGFDNHLYTLSFNMSAVHLFSTLPCSAISSIENLYVVDGSILPDSPHVNPQATMMCISKSITNDFASKYV